ncbi:MAG: NAD(P)H-dependent oxidoreductase [Clostridia bacterium]|nr:NAD(P)H-dependent oxidoreductase [Clostridia bacterium]
MKKLLYVDCCIRREESRTKRLAESFLKQVEARGEYEIERLTLMDENLACLMEGFFAQRQELLVTDPERKGPRFRYAHGFAEADRIVIAAPFWDLSFPALLKIYIENVNVDGITFRCDETGVYGLCKAKELLYITTRGADFTGEDEYLEQAFPYLESFCQYVGIERFRGVSADGLDLGLEPVDELLARAEAELTEIAKEF